MALRTGAIANNAQSNVDEQQAAAIGATIGPDGWWYLNGKKLSHDEADRLVNAVGAGVEGQEKWGTGGIIDRNRNFTGNLLRNVAPLAGLIPGVGGLAAAGIGAAAGAAGRGIQKGTNIGDILKQGVQSGGSAYGLDKLAGAASAGAKGGGLLGGAKSAAGAIPGVLKPVPVGGLGGLIPGLSGGMGGVGDWLKDFGLPAAGVANAAYLGQKSGNFADLAAKQADERWRAQGALRDKGIAGMLKPQPIDLSALEAQRQNGNPFALKPMPVGG